MTKQTETAKFEILPRSEWTVKTVYVCGVDTRIPNENEEA